MEAQGGAKAFMKKHRAMATLLPARGLNTVFFGDLATVDLPRLDLGGAIGAAIGRALQVNTTLWRISLRDNKLGPEGGAALARALEHNTALRQLSLRNNALGASGGAAIANALAANTTLLQLDLGNNGLGERGGAAIGRALGGGATCSSSTRCGGRGRDRRRAGGGHGAAAAQPVALQPKRGRGGAHPEVL